MKDDAIGEEQRHLDTAIARRDELLDELRAAGSRVGAHDAVGSTVASGRRRRVRELEGTGPDLVFGRLDALDGTVRHVGRVGVPARDDDADPLVVDWRAPVARPFYTATPLEPEGQARRRHVRSRDGRVVHVEDEPLDESALDGPLGAGLVGEGALLHALAERRTGTMRTAIATLQREQDAVVRADPRGLLVVQGGPGTGKTVVALHRVAYLLFTHPHLAERGVLVVGPSTRFLDYVSQVLPALGETQVVATTCARLVPGVRAERDEPRAVAEVKGRALWQDGLAAYVASLVPAAAALHLHVDGEAYVLPARRVARALAAAQSGGRSYHQARRVVHEHLVDLLVDAAAERSAELLAQAEEGFEDVLARVDASLARADDRAASSGARGAEVDGVLSDEDLDAARERIAADPALAVALDAWWPRRDVPGTLRAFLRDRAALRRHLPALTVAEIEAVVTEPDGWAPSDVPLLDAVAELLGGTAPVEPPGEFLAQRAEQRRDWVYGHVVVDEGQELSPMQWHMLVRRCPTRSMTVVGDVDQTEAPQHHTTWAQALGPVLGDAWTAATLTTCYRTPAEVMALTGDVLRRAGSAHEPPRSVRTTGIEPRALTCPEERLVDVVGRTVRELEDRYAGGTVGVVAPGPRVAGLRAALGGDGRTVLDPAGAKGLEFDATVVVDPDGIAAQPRGWNALYVALTRCTQELAQVHVARDA
ncbi:HelD family protein [Cellulomonas sp. NS3]|uniref:HelD family protein n=1 Tax=Cellulomonas sp. NS3 TaxID=2973977 RepID=UPI00216115F5|nr:AAA family ATPase [Cellulomonas sp. NS3]